MSRDEADIAALKERLREAEARTAQLERELHWRDEVLRGLPSGVLLVRLGDGSIVYANPCIEKMFGYAPGELLGQSVAVINAGDSAEADALRQQVTASMMRDGHWAGELTNVRKDGTPLHCYASVAVFEHPEHGPTGYGVHEDISHIKEHQESLSLMLRELDHRTKNTLAIILGLLEFSRSGARTIDEFAERFEGRIRAVASVHEVLASRQWAGGDLNELLVKLLSLWPARTARVCIDPAPLELGPNELTNLGLALHELFSNAAVHGALAEEAPHGRVHIRQLEDGDARLARIEWLEEGLTGLEEPTERGRGIELIEMLLSYSLKGNATFSWRPTGLRCELSFSGGGAGI